MKQEIYGITHDGERLLIEFDRWGGGELRYVPQNDDFKYIYVPFLSFETLEKVIVFWRHHPVKRIVVGYLSYSRADKDIPERNERVLSDMLLSLLRSQVGSTEICVIDVHNPDTLRATGAINWDTSYTLLRHFETINPCKYQLVAPDAGCERRLSLLDFNYVCAKKRYDDGSLTLELVENDPKRDCSTYAIVDDICDGGRTFVHVANAIRERDKNAEIWLLVSHALLPFGTAELEKVLTGIVTLDTCQSESNGFIHVIK